MIRGTGRALATGLLGWRATVPDETGAPAVITEYPHSHERCIASYVEAGLEVLGCLEPTLSPERAVAEAKAGLTDAYRAALGGLPVVIVWDLRRA